MFNKCFLPHDNANRNFSKREDLCPVNQVFCKSHVRDMLGLEATKTPVVITSTLSDMAKGRPSSATRGYIFTAVDQSGENNTVVFEPEDVIIPTRAEAMRQFQDIDEDLGKMLNKGYKLFSNAATKTFRKKFIGKRFVPSRKKWDCDDTDVDDIYNDYKNLYQNRNEYNVYRVALCNLFEPYKKGYNPSNDEIERYNKEIFESVDSEFRIVRSIQHSCRSAFELMSQSENNIEKRYRKLYDAGPKSKSECLLFANISENPVTTEQKIAEENLFLATELDIGIYSGQFLVYLNAFDTFIGEKDDKILYRFSQNKPNVRFNVNKGFIATRYIVHGEELVLEKLPFMNQGNKEKNYICLSSFYDLKFQMTEISQKHETKNHPTQLSTKTNTLNKHNNYAQVVVKSW